MVTLMKQRNFVAKHARQFNKAVVFKDKRKSDKQVRNVKHKGKSWN